MDDDRIKGTGKKAEGSIKEGVGKATGDRSQQAEGMAKKAEGSVQKEFGKAKDATKKD